MSTSKQQIGRLLALVPYLQSRPEVRLDEAAADFGVTPKQLRRDLDVLWFCGYPGHGMGDLIEIDMEAVDGEGVIRLSNADYLRRPLRLAGTEAAAIMVALRAMREGAPAEESAIIDRTLDKIEGAAGTAIVTDGTVEIRGTQSPDSSEEATRSIVSGALAAGTRLRLDYLSAGRDQTTSRVVDPVDLVEWEGHGYLRAWCHLAEDYRTFRLDRIDSVEALDEPVSTHGDAPPLDLDAGIFSPATDAPLATLTLSPEGRWVAEYHPVESIVEGADGVVVVTLRVLSPDWLLRLLMRIGDALLGVEPADLRFAIRDRARETLGNY